MARGWLKHNGLLLLGLMMSIGLHIGLVQGLQRMPQERPQRDQLITLEVHELEVSAPSPTPFPEPPPTPKPLPPPTPKPLPPPTPKPPPPPTLKPIPVDPEIAPEPLEGDPEPPPEVSEPPPDLETSALPLAGLTGESFDGLSAGKGPTFGAGNTLMAKPPEKMARLDEVQPYSPPVDLFDITTEPVLRDRPDPLAVFGADYPPKAKAEGVEGLTRVKLLIDARGRVIKVKAIKGPKLLRKPAEDLARRFRYKPATQRGRPVSVWWFEDIPFRIND